MEHLPSVKFLHLSYSPVTEGTPSFYFETTESTDAQIKRLGNLDSVTLPKVATQ